MRVLRTPEERYADLRAIPLRRTIPAWTGCACTTWTKGRGAALPC